MSSSAPTGGSPWMEMMDRRWEEVAKRVPPHWMPPWISRIALHRNGYTRIARPLAYGGYRRGS